LDGESTIMTTALHGLRVLDLSRYVAGAYCAKMLAAFGAEVIKVEPPGTGDPARAVGPFLHDRPDPETSALFLYLNTGKQGLTLNLKHPQGVDILKALVRDTDILVENFRPSVMPGLGLDYATLRTVNPRLIMVSISSFGQSGPYRDYKANSMIAYALGGYMYLNGHAEREPLSGGGRQPAYQGALHGYAGALAALMARAQSGQGQQVDISIQECMASLHQFTINRYVYVGRIQTRLGNRYQRAHPITIYPCQDGLISLAVSQQEQYERLLALTGLTELLHDARFATTFACSEHSAAFDEYLAPWLQAHRKHDIVQRCQANRIPAGFVNDVAEVLDDPQYRFRGFWHELDHPVAGRQTYAGLPFHMSETPPVLTRACLLGEHTHDILTTRLGYTASQLTALRDQGVI
jgi:crotonobetainyl-CoA:carnitine CoA-transferase CaiB-like acyl-CoA transferase